MRGRARRLLKWPLLVLLMVAPHVTGAQTPRTIGDSTRCLGCESPRKFRRAVAELMSFQLVNYGFSRWIANDTVGQTTFQTWSANLRHGFEWDNDHFPVNQLAHPYSGNLYFNSA